MSDTTVGIDTSYVNSFAYVELGEAAGQTFYAPATTIVSLTVWRSKEWTYNNSVWHVFIMGVDSTGRPDVHNIIRDGPTLMILNGDGIHPTPFRFQFEPAVELPSSGMYEFAIQADLCVGAFDLAGDLSSGVDYPTGTSWRHGRQTFSCTDQPANYPTEFPLSDLVFQIEFCQQNAPVRSLTWGQIKAVYR